MKNNETIYLCVTNDLVNDQRVARIAETLASQGYSIAYIGRVVSPRRPFESMFRYHRIKCLFNTGPLFYLEFNIRLFFYLLVRKWEAVVANDADTLLGCGLAARLKRRHLVYDSHELFTEVPELTGRRLKRWIWHWIQSFWVPKATLCYTVGPKLALRLSLTYGKEFLSVRNVPRRKSIEVERLENIMLYQGTLNIGRGLEEAIMSLNELPEWQLWIAGSGPLLKQLKDLALTRGVKDRVTFYGSISPSHLHDLTCRATVGLNLLKEDSLNYYYSLANKFFDYVQAGIPSINMNFPEYRDLCAEYKVAVLLDACSTGTLVSAIHHLQDKKRYLAYSEVCKQAAMVWNWEIEEKKIINAYHQMFSED